MTSVVVVSWNSYKDLQKLLAGLDVLEAQSSLEFIIVDNNSAEPTQTVLRNLKAKYFNVKVIYNEGNFGFAKACNTGARVASGDIILFLNPDTIADIKTVLEASRRVRNSLEYQILGVQQLSDHGVTRTCCHHLTRANTLISCSGLNKVSKYLFRGFEMLEWDHLDSRYVGHVIGAFYCMKKSSFDRLQGFDEKFFLYYEDLDLSIRALKAEMKIFYDTTLKIYHKGGGSSEKIGVRRLQYSVLSRDQLIEKHFGHFHQILCRLCAFFIELPLRFAESAFKRQFVNLVPFLKIYWKLLWSPI